jgi:hypothetical protein
LFYRILDAKQPFPKQENIMGDLWTLRVRIQWKDTVFIIESTREGKWLCHLFLAFVGAETVALFQQTSHCISNNLQQYYKQAKSVCLSVCLAGCARYRVYFCKTNNLRQYYSLTVCLFVCACLHAFLFVCQCMR